MKNTKPTLRPALEVILDTLTPLEIKALTAAWNSSRSNGHDFGFSDDVKVAGCTAQQNGALMTNLLTKGLMRSYEDMPGVCQIEFCGFGSHDSSEVDKHATAEQVKTWLSWKGVTL